MTTHTQDRDAVTLTAAVDDGYMAVHIGYGIKQPAHPSGYFSVTASIYPSRGAFELGASDSIHSCGCLHEQVLAAFPELAPLVALHSANVETGEPSSVANAWYWYQGSRTNILHDQYHGGNTTIYHHQLESRGLPDTTEGRRRYCYALACEILRVESIPIDMTGWTPTEPEGVREQYTTAVRARFLAFVDDQRERWAREAESARELISAHATRSETVPADVPSGETYSHTFEDGLHVSARCEDPPKFDDIGGHLHYRVKVSAPGASHTAHFYGSAADYDDGKIDARQAALGVLRELVSYRDQSSDEMFAEFGMDPETDRATLTAMRRQERAYQRMSDAIDSNSHLFS